VGVAAALALLAGCGSSALTETPHGRQPAGGAGVSATPAGDRALRSSVAKLALISQDGCQTGPPEQVYPGCERFLAELRSAATTIRDDAGSLPNAGAVRATANSILAAADAYDRDGCGGGPYDAGSPNAGRCVTDLSQVRTGLSTLEDETQGLAGQ